MGSIVDKYPLDRLQGRGLELSFLCPYCGRSRIVMRSADALNYWNGVECRKCHCRVVLDSLSLLVLKEMPEFTSRTCAASSGRSAQP
ncbi:MAG: hypothetical protein AB1665_07115 [Candidatus Thermoplasmatota archaeon]